MTSISQPAVLPPQASGNASHAIAQAHATSTSASGKTSPQAAVPAPATARSYANATKKPFSSSSASSNTTPPVAGAVAAPIQHGKSDSISPVNGKTSIPPAIPTLGGPAIANGNSAANSPAGVSDHSRQPSVTISAAGTSGYMINGGPVGGKPTGGNAIQFGSINAGGPPVASQNTPQLNQSASSLAVNTPSNPRISSPQTSPSPIPQPPASGGRPPSSLQSQGNGLSFGSLGGEDANRQVRPGGIPQGPLAPGQQPGHLRRESAHSTHSDLSNPGMGPPSGRGGYPQQGARGRGGYGAQYSQQQMGYPPGASFRGSTNQSRGGGNMGSQYQSQQRPLASPFPNPPHQAARSPALANVNPATPHMGHIPMVSQQMHPQPYGGYPQHMGPPQAQFMPNFDPSYGYYATPYGMHHQMQFPPSSPRPPFHMVQGPQPPYVTGQYGGQQPQPMTRTSSAISTSDRPTSSMGQQSTPITTPAVSHPPAASRGTNSPAPKSANFQIPPRKSAGLVIKDPSGAIKTFEKQPESPARSTRSPAIASTTPTPPPRTPSHADTQHNRTDSKTVKSGEEIKNEMKDAIAKKIEADKAEEKRKKEEEEAKALKEKEEADAKILREKEEAEKKEREAEKARMEAEEAAKKDKADAEQARQADEAAARAKEAEEAAAKEKEEAAEKARKEQEEEEEFARIEEEMARKEAEAEERYQKKKQAEREEKARKEAEEAAMADEDMKKAEREAEALEEARLEKLKESEDNDTKERAELFAALKISDAPATPSDDVAPTAKTPVESGTATPVSETSMPPPLRATSGGKQKPAHLKLDAVKPVEPAQPSAALQSLRSARFLTSVNDVSYPAAIASPNPALNTAAPQGKFRYDKNFLLQFQSVFTEKPSESWVEKVKETVGDTSDSSSRPGSVRTPSMMGPRQQSRPSLPQAFTGMGTFAQPGGRTLAPGPATGKGYREPAGGVGRPQQQTMQNPLASFANRPGGFPVGMASNMTRTSSSTSLASHPQSPRSNTSQRGRGGGSRGGRVPRESDKDAKSMPLTVGVDLKPIVTTATGWKPRSVGVNATGAAGPAPGGAGHMAPDVVQRKVKSNLNKMTPNNFDKISDQILEIAGQSKDETDGRTLRQVIQLTFEKATDEAHWAQMYAEFCQRMLQSMSPEIKDENIRDKNGHVVVGGNLFRKYLLNRCQEEFERGWKMHLPDKPEGESKEEVMLSDEYYIAAAAKRRGLGLVRFIGELYKLGMLTERIMHECVKKLVDYEGIPDEAEVESLTSLLKTIGQNLDSTDKGRPLMDIYFGRINTMIDTEGLPSRLRFMLMDIVDLRKKRWESKQAIKGPVTLEEVRQQAVEAERQKEQQRQQDASSRRAGGGGGGGGGGRMPMGRGDARNFSGGGQYGMMPPPDYQKNLVGMDDLRRLGSKGGSRQVSSQGPMSFGPTSMFTARSSSGRAGKSSLGPGGIASRGEESGVSSRTGTPPSQREKREKEEKEASASANTFSALASLGNSTDPSSPPSSPPTAKSSNISERQQSKQADKGDSKDDDDDADAGAS
ncbi:MAG: hypothetical protein FRX48_03494 [Lasallia pustulata]|uniref:MIF4G domain-containing protein n=1 Tax=Lasallia pustulata TaxID=136370 RepID=A0A5M8PUZ0_9LECA|nr:MAG: hypothetical protein FRX48_03494 [Lasallia pustulata]